MSSKPKLNKNKKKKRQQYAAPEPGAGVRLVDGEIIGTIEPTPLPEPAKEKKKPVPCSTEQKQLFDLLADFSVATVLGWVSNAYKEFSREAMRTTFLNLVLSQFAEEYFNNCANWVYDRSDPYINEKFDAMLAIDIPEIRATDNKPYDPMDFLNIIVPMSMQTLATMNISSIISDDYETTMKAVRAHLQSIVRDFSHIAAGFRGCDCGVPHTPPKAGERVFDVQLRQATVMPDGNVKIEDNWFEDV